MESDLTGLDTAKPRLPWQVEPTLAGSVCPLSSSKPVST